MRERTISSHQLRPLPVPLRAYNEVAGWASSLGGSRTISASTLLARAQRTTQLEEFGSMDFIEPLDQLVQALQAEACLHPFGRFVAQKRLINLLANRLRAVDWWSRHPEILQEDIAPPILIAGMQRTGTTLLHRLLSLDDRLRSLKSWEALNPAPYPIRDPSRRIKEAAISEKALKYLAPDFFAIHPVHHLSPEEDILLLDMSLRSTVAEATTHVPTFASWLEGQDQKPAYAFMRKLLQLLQWSGPGGRWILKSPHHLEWLDTLDDVFPGTKYLQTHRHPKEIVPSLCSMIYHSRVMFSNHNLPSDVGKHWINKMERMLARSMAFREHHPDRFHDIDYRQFVKDPLHTLQGIYKFLEMPLEDTLADKVKAFLASHGQRRFGTHAYQLRDFTDEDIMERPVFQSYVERFDLS